MFIINPFITHFLLLIFRHGPIRWQANDHTGDPLGGPRSAIVKRPVFPMNHRAHVAALDFPRAI